MGSGSTAVAAVRTERHYVGFDTDEEYVALAERRIAEERAATAQPAADGRRAPRVTVPRGRSSTARHGAGADRRGAAGGQGWARRRNEFAHQALVAEWVRGHRVQRGLPATSGSPWTSGPGMRPAGGGSSSWPGAYSATRPGLRRPDVLWRALGKASVLHEVRRRDPARDDLGPLVLLSTDAPAARSAGAKALRAVQGDDRSGPVHDVVELLDPECMERLRPAMRPG